jgi:hypothetical protein
LVVGEHAGDLILIELVGALGDELLGASGNLLDESLDVGFRGRWDGAKDDASIGLLDEDTVGEDVVVVTVQVEEGAKALHEGDGTAHGIAQPEASCGSPLPGIDLSQCHAEDGTEQVVIDGQRDAHSPRNTQDPLPVGHRGQDVVDQVGGSICHAPGGARRAEAAAFAGEGDELFVATLATLDANEAVPQLAAVEVPFEFPLDEGRVSEAVLASLASMSQAGRQIASHDAVQGAFLWCAPSIAEGLSRSVQCP